jgi:hypothetical protein
VLARISLQVLLSIALTYLHNTTFDVTLVDDWGLRESMGETLGYWEKDVEEGGAELWVASEFLRDLVLGFCSDVNFQPVSHGRTMFEGR